HVNSGGRQIVESGGQASGSVVSGSGAELIVGAGGTASGTTLSGGGFDIVLGTAVSTTINSGSSEDDRGAARGANGNSGGLQVVESGGQASGSVVSGRGGELIVGSGGTASGTTLSGGGFDIVFGTAVSTTIGSGGKEDDWATERGAQVNGGGLLVVE